MNWEIKYAIEQGKNVVGVFAQGATDADVPEELQNAAMPPIVGWQGDRVVDAINGKICRMGRSRKLERREPREWTVKRYSCG